MKNKVIAYVFYGVIFVIICLMSILCARRYYLVKNNVLYEDVMANLYISYNNGDTIKVWNNEYIDYDLDFYINNNSDYTGKYSITFECNSNISYSIVGYGKNSSDDVINYSGVCDKNNKLYGIIGSNNSHYYTINIKGDNLKGFTGKVIVKGE